MRMVALGSVCDIIMGQAPAGDTYNSDLNGLPLIAGASDFGSIVPMPTRHTTAATKISQVNDIIVCVRATIGNLNWSDKTYCLGRGVAAVRVHSGKADRNYIWRVIECGAERLAALGRGATFKQISKPDIANFEIPLPPLEEQKRIAAILDQADSLRRARRRAIEKLHTLAQSIFYEMFGDLSNPNDLRKKFKTCPLNKVVDFKGGGTPSKSNKDYYTGDIPWVTPKDMKVWEVTTSQDKITQEAIQNSATNLIQENSVLIVNRSGILKHTLPVAITRKPVAINQDMKALIAKPQLKPDFLAHLIKSAEPIVLKWVRATTADNFPIDNLKDLEIPIPDIKIQEKFVAIVQLISKQIRTLETNLDMLESLFSSLQHRAFRGEL